MRQSSWRIDGVEEDGHLNMCLLKLQDHAGIDPTTAASNNYTIEIHVKYHRKSIKLVIQLDFIHVQQKGCDWQKVSVTNSSFHSSEFLRKLLGFLETIQLQTIAKEEDVHEEEDHPEGGKHQQKHLEKHDILEKRSGLLVDIGKYLIHLFII